ncbi:hypothetical protein BH23BAC3_BH23BAC3_31560 [soil metagenome]
MNQLQLILERQWIHAIILVLLIFLMIIFTEINGIQVGTLWGLTTMHWYWIAVSIPILHQVFVWFCWRTQLHANLLSRSFGDYDFTVYTIGFSIFGISRVLSVLILAISNRGTLPGDPTLFGALAILALIPAIYLFYSVKRYFGFKHALGIDHFDESYRNLPLVREGIFRFTSNGMYIYGFLLFWAIALWYASIAALCAALFNHIYIWVHYYTTELPDMKKIYGEESLTELNGKA